MARDYTYPPAPEPLPLPVPDNHTHIEPGQGPGGGVEQLTLDEQVARGKAVGIDRFVQCGCDLDAARWTAHAVQIEPALLGAIAIHPNEAARMAARTQATRMDDDGPRVGPSSCAGVGAGKGVSMGGGLPPCAEAGAGVSPAGSLWPGPSSSEYEAALAEVARMAKEQERIRAIGETGLDYYRTGPEGHAAQEQAFRDHIALAKELGLAMQIHDRDAHGDILRVLAHDGAPERTVFHCFSGDREMAEILAANGWYLSVAGTVTFAGAGELREAVASMPLTKLLVETDAPYLTPHPFRGRPNAPYMAATTVRAIAALHDVSLDVACSTLAETTVRVYGSW